MGAQPDMLTFTPDGEAVLVANEGEANNHINVPPNPYDSDPVGSVSVIDLRLVNNPLDAAELQLLGIVRTAGFEQFNAEAPALRARGVRIYGPDDLDDADSLPASVAQDLEPEYIAVAHDGESAWVTLQEANAIGVLDLSDLDAPYFSDIIPLGLKDHSLPGNELDAGDRDGIPATAARLNITQLAGEGDVSAGRRRELRDQGQDVLRARERRRRPKRLHGGRGDDPCAAPHPHVPARSGRFRQRHRWHAAGPTRTSAA